MNLTSIPTVKDLVLIGGGHSHISVLRRFGMKPIPGVQITLICPDVYTPYSGMLPGFVAGHYAFDDIHIDLAVLARFAGARLFVDEVVGIDPNNKRIRCANRPDVPYDVASINVGSTPNTVDVPGAANVVVPVKPISGFAARWDSLSTNLKARRDGLKLGVVGGGAGGVELALAVNHRLRSTQKGLDAKAIKIHLATQESDILSSHNRRTSAALNYELEQSGITVHRNFRVCEVRPDALVNDRHETIEVDEILWATQAAAPAWFRSAGLAVDENGFLAVDRTLRSISHGTVFGAGDAASVSDHPRAKSGVFAVRQGRPLARNLRRVLVGCDPLPFTPQRTFLSLIATGPKNAVASRGPWAAGGQWAWQWKNWIDRRFIRRFTDLPEMAQIETPELAPGLASTQTLAVLENAEMRCGGCGAKVSAPVLGRVLARLKGVHRDDVLIGLDRPDDVAMITLPEGKALVQSVDSFRAMVGDPFLFGKITANHCLNDIYAMGATPQTALAIVSVPFGLEEKVEDTLSQLLTGALEILTAANTQLVGGHSAEGAELTLGFTVNGLVDQAQVLTKDRLQPGQRLIITKAIGTGTLFAAEMRGKARGHWIAHATQSMLASNRSAANCFKRYGATSCTDVTGFGVVGHVLEMLQPSQTELDLDVAALPLLQGATETIGAGIISSLHSRNLVRREMIANYEAAASDPRIALMFDPQTAGGLIAGVPEDQAENCLQELRTLGYSNCAAIGTVQPGSNTEKPIKLIL